MSKTKIVVVHLKEIIYTALFAGLGILLIILLIIMFLHKKDDSASTMNSKKYTPGVWTSSIILNDTALNLEVVLDANNINSVQIVNIDDTITTMFPLVKPSLESIANQLYEGVDIDSIVLSEDSKYTEQALIKAVKIALEKATPVEEAGNEK